MNERIKQLAEQAKQYAEDEQNDPLKIYTLDCFNEKFAELLLRNLADELLDVAKRSKKANKEWADGMNHAAMLAQRMTMALPQWPEAD